MLVGGNKSSRNSTFVETALPFRPETTVRASASSGQGFQSEEPYVVAADVYLAVPGETLPMS
jgi:hypothetical protein